MNTQKNKRTDYALEAEREFLSLLLSCAGDNHEDAIINRYGTEAEEYFLDDGNKLIYKAMLELAAKQKKIDCVAIAQLLINSNKLDRVGCISRLNAINDESSYSLTKNVRTHAADEQIAIMQAMWGRRQLQKLAVNGTYKHGD